MLLVPAIMGCVVYGVNMSATDADDGNAVGVSMILFGGFITLWSTVFAELWKRKSACYNLLWGTSDLAVVEKERPEFQGPWAPRGPVC